MSKSIMEDVKNKALRSSIKFWSLKSEYHNEVINRFMPLIQLIDKLDKEMQFGDKQLMLFVVGLFLVPIAQQKKESKLNELAESLLNPVFDILMKQTKSKYFQEEVLKKYVSGDERLWIDELEIPITVEKLQQYLSANNNFVITGDHVNQTIAEYTKYRKEIQLGRTKTNEGEYKSDTRLLIEKEFDHVKNAFQKESEYKDFIHLLTLFFEQKDYLLPKQCFTLTRGTKTKVATVFNPTHKLFSEDPLSKDKEYYDIIRIINHFSGLSDAEIYKMITR